MKLRHPVLLLGEDEIGVLEVRGNDMPWIYGAFSSLPPFEKVSALFHLLEHALKGDVEPAGKDDDLQLELLEQVNRLGLAVRDSNGAIETIRDFKIESGEFEYKADSYLLAESTLLINSDVDTRLPERLKDFVTREKGSIVEKEYSVAGSQEIIVYSITLPTGTIEVVSETYLGLSLRGPTELVSRIEAALRIP